MSGNSLFLEKGIFVKHKGKIKVVKNWFFMSSPIHNSDRIVIIFTDGTNTEDEGFKFIKKYTPQFRPKKKIKQRGVKEWR